MQIAEVIEQLNVLNTQVTEMQKTIVKTIRRLTADGLQQPNGDAELVLPNGRTLSSSATVAARQQMGSMAATIDAARTLVGQPPLAGTKETSAALDVMREHVKVGADALGQGASREQLADQAEGIALELLSKKIGPEFVQGVQAHRSGAMREELRAGLPPLVAKSPVAGQPPVVSNPNRTTEIETTRREEVLRARLIELLYGKNGVVQRWFSNSVYPAGTGVLKPTIDVDFYDADIERLGYERLVAWPEGFYTNAATGTYQYHAKTPEFSMVIDFGKLVSEDVATRQQAARITFHNDAQKRELLAVQLDGELLTHVISDLNQHFQNLWAARAKQ
jgi:hypothetical protein